MVLNKTAFSLASLVVLLALAFVGHTAMAGEFGVSMIITESIELTIGDVSSESGIQWEHSEANGGSSGRSGSIIIRFKFDKVVQLGDGTDDTDAEFIAADIQVIAYNKFGGIEASPQLFGPSAIPPADGKNFEINLLGPSANVTRILVFLAKHKVELADPRAELNDDGTRKAEGKNAEASITINYVTADGGAPTVYSIRRASDPLLPVTAATENVIILLSEQPKEFKKDRVDVTNATWIDPLALEPIPDDADGLDNDVASTADNMDSTGRDNKLYPYVLTITPKYANKDDIVVKVKAFEDMVLPDPSQPTAMKYTPPAREVNYVEGRSKLTIKVGKEVLKDKTGGFEVLIPKEIRIPNGGYLVAATDIGGSGIKDNPENDKDEPKASERTPAQLLYNVIVAPLPNLETFLANGGTIDLIAPNDLVISEIMWGSDASLEVNNKSQWIEIQNNSGASILTGDKTHKLMFYGPNETPPAKTAAVAATATAVAVPAALPAGVVDRVGTIDDKGGYWSLAGKGQSGRTGQDEKAAELTALIPTQALVSMYRVVDAKDEELDGNTAAAWMQSTPPSVNFDAAKVGVRIASPGASRLITAAELAADAAAAKAKAAAAAAAATKAADTSVSMPQVGQIYISEVMFAGGGTLPQWIEISNGSRSEQVNLSSWTLTVENATADADVSVGSKAVFTIPEGTRIDPSSQSDTPSTILVVTEQGRNNIDDGAKGAGQILNLWTAQQTELILLGVTKRRYSLLSDMAFQITLAPPVPIVAPAATTAAPTTAAGIAAARTAAAKAAADAIAAKERADATDVAGNLGTAGTATWALPMDEGARSSIIRRHVPVSIGAAAPEAGEMMDSWALASDTSFAQVTHIRASSYYGSADDVGTPGFRAGGALPVELSHFRPARNKDTGAVVITWSTQSELNNAGFFIKRSQQRDGQFQIINATMIAGAGTTSEKQFYTYEDTTAQPNVVYYYQIEDVSLNGNRQTLTNSIRLKGHVGAAGKATTTWGDLKTQK